jgi:hypothetical protein
MFFVFLLKLGLATILSTLGFALAWLPGVTLLVVSGKKKIPVAILAVAGDLPFAFCCGAWAAYCAAFAHEHASAHRLGWNWLYFVAPFFFCTVPLSLGFSESVRLHSPLGKEESWELGLLAMSSKRVIRAAYVVFGIWPSLADLSYG